MIVGGVAFIFDFGTLYLFTEYLGLHYILSATISFIIGLLINYTLSIYFVFNKRSLKNKKIEFFIFLIIGIFGLIFNDVVIWVLTDIFYLYYLVSKMVATLFTYIWNFFARKYLLFK